MKKLKPYLKTEMNFIEIIHSQKVLAGSDHLNVGGMDPKEEGDDKETGELDAAIFRQGIWDEE